MNKPKHFNRLRREFPAYIAAVEQIGATTKSIGPLEPRICELVQLGSAAACHSEGAVHSHARRAMAAGATRAEIDHALLCLTSTIGFPAVSAAISWVDDLD